MIDLDPLTGTLNRRSFAACVPLYVTHCHLTKRPLTVLHLDLDNLKSVNDQRGFLAGDETLRRTGALLHQTFGTKALVSRPCSDEFQILTDQGGDVWLAVEWLFYRIRPAVGLSCCIGAITFPESPSQAQEALREAKELMLFGKLTGGNRLTHC